VTAALPRGRNLFEQSGIEPGGKVLKTQLREQASSGEALR